MNGRVAVRVVLLGGHLNAASSLEQMAPASPRPPRPDRIARKEALHAHVQIGTGCIHQQMQMISYHDVTCQLPSTTTNRLLEPLNQSVSVRIIANDFCRAMPRAMT
jgi:hypothetical protein